MSNYETDNLEEEAKALSDTIKGMPDHDDADEEEESNVLLSEPKKNKPVLKMIVGVGGALLIGMGGLFVYSQYMAPVATYTPSTRQMPVLDPAPSAPVDSVKPVEAAPDSTKVEQNAAPVGLPGTESAGNATPFDNAKPAEAQAKKDIPDFGAPAEKPLQTTKLNDVVPVETVNKPAELKILATEKTTQVKAEKVVKKKVAKKSVNKPQTKKPVLPLPNQQQTDNGYNELF